MNLKKIIILFVIVFGFKYAQAVNFDELDKVPGGAHAGQQFVAGWVSMGIPFGSVLTAERNFLKNNVYEVSADTFKRLWVNHLHFGIGASYEYMPIDHLGVKGKLGYTTVFQKTQFGSDNRNWSTPLYNELVFLVGPSFHLTNRKKWDVIFTPYVGYAFASYKPTPIAATLLDDYSSGKSKNVSNFAFGSEIAIVGYFSGGFFMSLGLDWNLRLLDFGSGFNLTQNEKTFFPGGKSSKIHSFDITISAGYAFLSD
jgi:hypothetical protein